MLDWVSCCGQPTVATLEFTIWNNLQNYGLFSALPRIILNTFAVNISCTWCIYAQCCRAANGNCTLHCIPTQLLLVFEGEGQFLFWFEGIVDGMPIFPLCGPWGGDYFLHRSSHFTIYLHTVKKDLVSLKAHWKTLGRSKTIFCNSVCFFAIGSKFQKAWALQKLFQAK
jgi:hypothetical protein